MDSDSEVDAESEDDEDRSSSGNRILSLDLFKKNVEEHPSCKVCNGAIEMLETKRIGSGSDFIFKCLNKKCTVNVSFTSDPMIDITSNESGSLKVHSINRQAMFAMRTVGVGLVALQRFCGVMDLPPPVHKSSFHKIKDTVHSVVSAASRDCMEKAGKAEYRHTEGGVIRDIDVSVDGTYMTRGFSSKCGGHCY